MTDPKFPYGYDVEPCIQKAQDAPDPQSAYKPVETARATSAGFWASTAPWCPVATSTCIKKIWKPIKVWSDSNVEIAGAQSPVLRRDTNIDGSIDAVDAFEIQYAALHGGGFPVG